MLKVTGFCCLAALAMTSLPVIPAVAGPARAEKFAKRTVSYRDLDLSRAGDVDRLRKRVSSAAYGVCVSDADGRFVGPSASSRLACHADVMARTEPQLARLAERTREAKTGGAATAVTAATMITIAR